MRRRLIVCVWVMIGGLVSGAPPAATGTGPLTKEAGSPVEGFVNERVTAAWEAAGARKWSESQTDALEALAALATYGSDRDAEGFGEAAFVRRLFASLNAVDSESRLALLTYFRTHEELAKDMAFALESKEKSKTAYALLARLIKERPQVVERLPNLAAAIALVHDTPLERQINENKVTAVDPVALLDYFSTNESRMFFGLKKMPVNLLTYVVDTTSSVSDLNWALQHYGGNRNVGELFFNVRYDWNALTLNRAKDVTKQGYTLSNILRLGGVCADQAYFATEVAKAIGVPSAFTTASSAEVAHAWVGFLQMDGKRVHWNFDSGRYESYRNVRGDVMDPVTREEVPDSFVSLLAESAVADPESKQIAAGFTDAAMLMLEKIRASATTAPRFAEQLPGNLTATGLPERQASVQSALDLIEMGLHHSSDYAPGWEAVGKLAATGKMSIEEKRRWADLIQRLCGQKYPDFAVAILDPMIRTVGDATAQSRLWDGLFANLQGRPDLAAQVRIRQGDLWEKQDSLLKAGQAYEDVIRRFVNSTPYALLAVQKAEGILKQLGRTDQILPLYKRAMTSATRPESMMAPEFLKQSNWYKLRAAYAEKLVEAGRIQEAKALLPDVTPTISPHN